MESKTTTLPELPQDRLALKNRIQQKIVKLQAELEQGRDDEDIVKRCETSIARLKLRLTLIAKCGEISLLRLGHIEDVFKHYCMNVFRTGKHMTFDRLVHDRVHMTVERFCLFLRDFQATGAVINNKYCEILEKPIIVTTFKKAASNARELSFEEFIQCIDKLAIMHWDGTEGYQQKQKQREQERERIKQINERRRKKKKGQKEQEKEVDQKAEGEEGKQEQDEEGGEQKEKENQENQQKAANNNENDDLINEMMNDEDIEDPNEEVRQLAERAQQENQAMEEALVAQKKEEEELLRLTKEEKIEFYYQSLDIDSVDAYKKKMTSLNLPNLQNYSQKNQQQSKALSESKLVAAQQEEARLHQLKAKMTEKLAKKKDRPLPKPSNQKALKEQQNSRKRKQARQERENAVKQIKKIEQVRKTEPKKATIQYKEGEISWQILEKVGLDQLRIKQFNPTSFYAPSEDDRYFLDEYGAKPKITSRLQAREKQSLSIAKDTRMRADQLQRKQKQKERQKKGAEFSKNKR